VLSFLDKQSLLTAAAVSRVWLELSEDEHLWTTRAASVQTNVDALPVIDWPGTRYARVHSACPSKALYMRERSVAANWRRPTQDRQVVRGHVGLSTDICFIQMLA
jgi:hypothetical protein